MSYEAVREAFNKATPGTRVVYWRGYLSRDRANEELKEEANKCSSFAINMMENGLAALYQKRTKRAVPVKNIFFGEFVYYMVKI